MAVIGNEGKLLVFPVAEVPEMPKGKGNKLYDVNAQQFFGKRTEFLAAMAVVPKGGSLVLWAGGKSKTLEWADLKTYKGQRAQRGTALPRGWPRSVDTLEGRGA